MKTYLLSHVCLALVYQYQRILIAMGVDEPPGRRLSVSNDAVWLCMSCLQSLTLHRLWRAEWSKRLPMSLADYILSMTAIIHTLWDIGLEGELRDIRLSFPCTLLAISLVVHLLPKVRKWRYYKAFIKWLSGIHARFLLLLTKEAGIRVADLQPLMQDRFPLAIQQAVHNLRQHHYTVQAPNQSTINFPAELVVPNHHYLMRAERDLIQTAEADDIECASCWDTEPVGTGMGELPCGHIFHAVCIGKWFKEKRVPTCPTCRRQFAWGLFSRDN